MSCSKSDQHVHGRDGDHHHQEEDDPSQYQLVKDESEHQHLHISTDMIKKWGIQISAPQKKNFYQKIALTGLIQVNQETSYQIAARIGGNVISMKKDISDVVHRGQVLCTINSPQILELKTTFIKAFQNYQLSRSNYLRAASLARVKALEKRELLNRETAYKTAAAEFFSLQADLRRLDYDKKILDEVMAASQKNNLEPMRKFLTPRHPIKAPAAGKILDRKLSLGQRVEENDIIYELADMSQPWAILDAKESDIAFLSIGKIVEIETDVYPQLTFSGKIITIFEKIDRELRTHRIRVLVTNKMSRLRPDMYVRGQVKTDVKNQYFCLPQDAMVKVSGIDAIFIKETDGFALKPVQVIAVDSDGNTFIQDLTGREMVVTKGAFYLKAEYEISKGKPDAHAGHQH
jgi:cobalt-zinc-cadmium efflux system membrane fusion protein